LDGTDRLKNLKAGTEDITVTIGGFKMKVEKMIFDDEKISFGRAEIQFGGTMSGMTLGIKDAKIFYDGRFEGDVEVTDWSFNYGGVDLSFIKPSLDVGREQIFFEKASISVFGASDIDLKNVKISPSGISFDGKIKLPNFSIPGGLGFRNVWVKFENPQGEPIMFSGNAECNIPGVGEIAATIVIQKKQENFFEKIKYASLTYTMDIPGIPLGTTGLELYKINGKMSVGLDGIDRDGHGNIPFPAKLKEYNFFGDKPKVLSLSLGIRDVAGGHLLKGGAGVWIDITDFDWAFGVNASVLKGLIKGEVAAGLNAIGFVAHGKLTMTYAEGQVTFWVTPGNVGGEGSLDFVVREGTFGSISFEVPVIRKWRLRWKNHPL
jgi:hypothetical protein